MQSNPETVSQRIAELLDALDNEFPDLAIAIVVGAEMDGAGVALTRVTNLSSEGFVDMLEDVLEVEAAREGEDEDDEQDEPTMACDCPACLEDLAWVARQNTIH